MAVRRCYTVRRPILMGRQGQSVRRDIMKYDVMVIGAGFSGGGPPTKLSGDPNKSELLLEAGPDFPDTNYFPNELCDRLSSTASAENSASNWSYLGQLTPSYSERAPIPRGKVVGGSGGPHRDTPEPSVQQASYPACVAAGFPQYPDMYHPYDSGVSRPPRTRGAGLPLSGRPLGPGTVVGGH